MRAASRLMRRRLSPLKVLASVTGLVGCLGVGVVGTESWILGAFQSEMRHQTWASRVADVGHRTVQSGIAGDESFWLSPAGATPLTPALQVQAEPSAARLDSEPHSARFQPGLRITLSGSTARHLIVETVVQVTGPTTPVTDRGAAAYLVTAVEKGSTRVVRFLVDAHEVAPPAPVNKAL
jgi:hypothetical protein